jgi:hypothetical protein
MCGSRRGAWKVAHTVAPRLVRAPDAQSAPRGWIRRWLAPEVAMGGATFTLLFGLFLFDAPVQLFRDSDTGWHIRTGEAILESIALPRIDPYSFSKGGQPWVAWEWGSDVLMGAAHRANGPAGVVLLYLAAISICTWLWFRLHWAVGGDFFLACALASPMLSTVNMHWLARPHVFSWVLLMGWLLAAESPPRRLRVRHLMAALAGGAIWANLHASFFILPLTSLLYAAGHWVHGLVWPVDRRLNSMALHWYSGIAAASAVGSFLNPYGWQLHRHLFTYLSNSELLARIGEFQSFNFHAEGAAQILLTVAVAGLGCVLALQQGKVGHFLLSAALIAMSLRSARALPLVALAVLPLANGAITQALRQASEFQTRWRRLLDGYLQYSGNLRAIDFQLRGYAMAPLFLALVFFALQAPALRARTGFPANQFPVEVAGHLDKLPASARILHPDKFGGYLIYRFSGARKVFFDGRSDFYGVDFMKDYIRLVQVRPGWRKQVTYYGFTHALLPNDYSLIPALEGLGWRKVHADRAATLLVAP